MDKESKYSKYLKRTDAFAYLLLGMVCAGVLYLILCGLTALLDAIFAWLGVL